MILIQSAIYGGYDKPKPLKIIGCNNGTSGAIATLCSDNSLQFDDPRIINDWVRLRYELPDIYSSMLKAKYWKTISPCTQMIDGDIFIWLDGSLTVTEPKLVEKCLEALGKDDASFMPHPDRKCIYDEAQFSLLFPRYQNCGIENQIEVYRKAGHPKDWGLIATTFFVVRICYWTRKLLADWWKHNLEYSHQDQLSLPFLLRESRESKWNYNLKWGEYWTRSEHLVQL